MSNNAKKDKATQRGLDLHDFVGGLKSVHENLSVLVSDLTNKYSNMAIFNLSEKITSLAKERHHFMEYLDDISPALYENSISLSYLKKYAIAGNNIGTLSELYRITQEIETPDMYESIVQDLSDSPYILNARPSTVTKYIADSILQFSKILESTHSIEKTISALFGESNSNKISEHLSFITSQGLLSLNTDSIGIPLSSTEGEIRDKILSSLQEINAILLSSTEIDSIKSTPDELNNIPKANFEKKEPSGIVSDDVLTSDPIKFGDENSSNPSVK